MDSLLQKFFERLYRILGFDIEIERLEAIRHFESWLAEQCNERLLTGSDQAARQRYETFMNQKPAPSPPEIASFWQSLRPGEDISRLLEETVREVTQGYVSRLLLNATAKQKAEAEAAFKELVKAM